MFDPGLAMYLFLYKRLVSELFSEAKSLAVFGSEPSSNFLQILENINVLTFNTSGIIT